MNGFTSDISSIIGFQPARSTLLLWEKEGRFPRRIRIGLRCYWLKSELQEWMAAKAASRTHETKTASKSPG